MKIILHKNFENKYKKLNSKEKEKFKAYRDKFSQDSFNSVINSHSLPEKYKGYRSFDVGGDSRVIYKPLSESGALFVAIDIHGHLYQ